jgi:hypothetical protein
MDVTDLVEIEKIKQLKAYYFYYMDHKDWDGWRKEVFTPDCELLYPDARPEPYIGVNELLEMLVAMLEGVTTIHHGHMPVIELTSTTTAKGIWAMEDILLFPEDRQEGIVGRVHGYGHYYETYVKGHNSWRIKTLELRRLHFGKLTGA